MKITTGRFVKACRAIALSLVFFSAIPSLAQQNEAALTVKVDTPWARASIGTKRPGAAYMTVRNTGNAPVTLVGLRADISGMASIHQSVTDASGVSSMTPAGDIEIPAGGVVLLEPGGYHGMLMQLQEPLIKGESFPLVLVFGDGTELLIEVPILGIGSRGPED